MNRPVFAFLGGILLAGILAGFGQWTGICVAEAMGHGIGHGLGDRIVAGFGVIFFGGVTLGSIVLYFGLLIVAPWRKSGASHE